MTRAQFMQGTDAACNKFVNHLNIKFEQLPRSARRRLEWFNSEIRRAGPGDVAYDLAMNDKGAAVERALRKQKDIAQERAHFIRSEFAKLIRSRFDSEGM